MSVEHASVAIMLSLPPIMGNLGGLAGRDGRGPDGGGAAARGDVPEVAIRTHRVIVTARRSEGYRYRRAGSKTGLVTQPCLDSVGYPNSRSAPDHAGVYWLSP